MNGIDFPFPFSFPIPIPILILYWTNVDVNIYHMRMGTVI